MEAAHLRMNQCFFYVSVRSDYTSSAEPYVSISRPLAKFPSTFGNITSMHFTHSEYNEPTAFMFRRSNYSDMEYPFLPGTRISLYLLSSTQRTISLFRPPWTRQMEAAHLRTNQCFFYASVRSDYTPSAEPYVSI